MWSALLSSALWCAVPGPVAQSGAAGAGMLLVLQEPGVDLLGIRVNATVTSENAHVSLTYTLVSAVDRQVEVAFAAAAYPTERDALSLTPPWRNVTLSADGEPLKTGTVEEPVARDSVVCLPPLVPQWKGPARAQVVRARVQLSSKKPLVVTLTYDADPMRDDWMDARGKVTRSARLLCIRPRPQRGFLGQLKGRSSGRVEVEGQPLREWDDVDDLSSVPDVMVRIP